MHSQIGVGNLCYGCTSMLPEHPSDRMCFWCHHNVVVCHDVTWCAWWCWLHCDLSSSMLHGDGVYIIHRLAFTLLHRCFQLIYLLAITARQRCWHIIISLHLHCFRSAYTLLTCLPLLCFRSGYTLFICLSSHCFRGAATLASSTRNMLHLYSCICTLSLLPTPLCH